MAIIVGPAGVSSILQGTAAADEIYGADLNDFLNGAVATATVPVGGGGICSDRVY